MWVRGCQACSPSVWNPSALTDYCVCSPFAVYTCWCEPALRASWDMDSVPQRKRRRRRWCRWWLQGQETQGTELSPFLLFDLKGDLKWSNPPRFIPKTCHLHTTVSAISTDQDVWKVTRNKKKNGNFQFVPSRSWNKSLKLFFFFPLLSWVLKTICWAVMGRWGLVHRFKRSLPTKKNRNCLLPVTTQGFWAVEQQFLFFWKEEKQLK